MEIQKENGKIGGKTGKRIPISKQFSLYHHLSHSRVYYQISTMKSQPRKSWETKEAQGQDTVGNEKKA